MMLCQDILDCGLAICESVSGDGIDSPITAVFPSSKLTLTLLFARVLSPHAQPYLTRQQTHLTHLLREMHPEDLST